METFKSFLLGFQIIIIIIILFGGAEDGSLTLGASHWLGQWSTPEPHPQPSPNVLKCTLLLSIVSTVHSYAFDCSFSDKIYTQPDPRIWSTLLDEFWQSVVLHHWYLPWELMESFSWWPRPVGPALWKRETGGLQNWAQPENSLI